MTKWDYRFLALADHIAEWSKDRSTKVGSVIVGPGHEVRSMGYNGFPRMVCDDKPQRHERPAKYLWTEHAERNAIYSAARFGCQVHGCTIYCTHHPCPDCARAIVQSGLDVAIFRAATGKGATDASLLVSATILREGGVKCQILPGS